MNTIKIVYNNTPSNQNFVPGAAAMMLEEGLLEARKLAHGYVIAGLRNEQRADTPAMRPKLVSVEEFGLLPLSNSGKIQYRIVAIFKVDDEVVPGLLARINT